MTLRKAIIGVIQYACNNTLTDIDENDWMDEAQMVWDNLARVEYFSDVPCIITDKDGNAWVSRNAKVGGSAVVGGDSIVC
jgi:hypothetical protein